MAKSGDNMWVILVVIFGLGMLASLFSNNNSPAPATFQIDASSPEHRYVKERFKLEGYSDADSKKAADAIYKFNQAQKARQEGLR